MTEQKTMTNRSSDWPADGSLPAHVQHFAEWLLTPRWERGDQKTQADYARANGRRPEQVSVWKKDKRFKRYIDTRCDELNLSTDRIQDVINAVYRSAVEGGDMKAATLYLQHANALKPKRIVIEDKRLGDMSDAELMEELAATGLLSAGNED